MKDIKSFRIVPQFNLPPGYSFEVVATLNAPETISVSDLEKTAYNSFAVKGRYLRGDNVGSNFTFSDFEPEKQPLIIKDSGEATLQNNGVVFRDYDANGQEITLNQGKTWVCIVQDTYRDNIVLE